MSKKNFTGILFALILAFSFGAAETYAISWDYNLSSALKRAKEVQKPVIADFYTEWCGWCKRLDTDTYGSSKVGNLAGKFICVKVDGDKHRDMVAKYGVRGYPTTIFFDCNGNVLDRIVGYVGPADFAAKMEGVLGKVKKSAPAVESKEAPVTIRNTAKKRTQNIIPEFVYNGYIKSANGEMIAQLNYGQETSFIKVGDVFRGYTVASIDSDTLVLEKNKKRVILEIKKPKKILW